MNKLVIGLTLSALSFPSLAEVASRDIGPNQNRINPPESNINTRTSEDTWTKIGTGSLKDFVISSIYGAFPVTISAEFEQNDVNPDIYRINRPFNNWSDTRASNVKYNPNYATPMVIHVVDGKYAWFEEFNTGLYIEEADEYGPIIGFISVVHTVANLIKNYGVETVYANYPSAFCTFDEGTFKLSEWRDEDNSPNVRIDVAGEPIWRGNKESSFSVNLPSARNLDPRFKWNDLKGKAKFTDGFTSLFAYKDTPQFPVFEVDVQQNEADPSVYRLVNPYSQWNLNTYSSYDFEYDSDNNYYITLYTFPEYGLACTDTFATGLNIRIKNSGDEFEMFNVQNQAYYFYDSYANAYYGWYLSEVAEEFGYMFGKFEDGAITYPATYEDEYNGQILEYPTFTGWTGTYYEAAENGYIYAVNKQGAFKVQLPEDENEDSNAIGELNPYDSRTIEYYDLLGRKINTPSKGCVVIERSGNRTNKIIFK